MQRQSIWCRHLIRDSPASHLKDGEDNSKNRTLITITSFTLSVNREQLSHSCSSDETVYDIEVRCCMQAMDKERE